MINGHINISIIPTAIVAHISLKLCLDSIINPQRPNRNHITKYMIIKEVIIFTPIKILDKALDETQAIGMAYYQDPNDFRTELL